MGTSPNNMQLPFDKTILSSKVGYFLIRMKLLISVMNTSFSTWMVAINNGFNLFTAIIICTAVNYTGMAPHPTTYLLVHKNNTVY